MRADGTRPALDFNMSIQWAGWVVAMCSAYLALGTMAATWRSYAACALSLRQQLASCDVVQELRFVTITTQVRTESPEVWRPGFRPLAAQMQAHRSHCRPALRAAA